MYSILRYNKRLRGGNVQDKSLREKLIQLGLSDYESRVYLAVVESPDSIASVIAKRGEVPRSKVYEVLYRLIDKGLVYQSESGKKRFLAIDPIAGFNILQTIYRKESQEKIKLFSEVPLLISSMLDSNIVVNDVASNVRTITDLKELAYYIMICLEESRSEILTFSKDCSALISIELPSIRLLLCHTPNLVAENPNIDLL
ncbi:MAG: hypothetical protein B6226_03045 [Candidatus Cloacimonetes bacterium 4572_65]|nr:MAG: hypothetical protein B6226_03045 [Candidatus Cloacimonetes bacterium 4572_65]